MAAHEQLHVHRICYDLYTMYYLQNEANEQHVYIRGFAMVFPYFVLWHSYNTQKHYGKFPASAKRQHVSCASVKEVINTSQTNPNNSAACHDVVLTAA